MEKQNYYTNEGILEFQGKWGKWINYIKDTKDFDKPTSNIINDAVVSYVCSSREN